ncbi:MAG: DNA gyrase inhibitor YacG [Verrucomicrobiota bacterium]
MSQKRLVKCPTCRKEGDWLAGQYGPFCSHRCKLIDLGKWLGEENRISEPLRPGHFAEYEDLAEGKKMDEPEP